jgi:hypothetical protein
MLLFSFPPIDKPGKRTKVSNPETNQPFKNIMG